ncbi:Hydantoinase B/oxoprolinase-domain-containing protein [Aspergillus crustosus]
MGSLGHTTPVSDLQVSIDRGGTFTDVVVVYPDGFEKVFKLLSRDPKNYQDAPIEALRRIVEEVTGTTVPRGVPLDLSCIGSLRMGTTVATNALVERQGAKTALFITRGFRIGNQSRPEMFALNVKRADLLYAKVVEVPERVTLHDSTSYRRTDEDALPASKINLPKRIDNCTSFDTDDVVVGLSGEKIRILEKLDMEFTSRELEETFAEGFRKIHTYLEGFKAGVEPQSLQSVNWRIMQPEGGLVHPSKLSGLRALLSGPAGGIIGYARTCYVPGKPKVVVGFDMGGTSTDVSRYAGSLEHVFESTTAGVSVQVPQLDINKVAAGGGSVLSWQKGILQVGPQSTGSHPGPACYRKGGSATITDANLVLGRILTECFPFIFGPSQDQALDVDASYQKIAALAHEINRDQGTTLSVYEVASGFITVANEMMCRPIRALTEAKGYAVSDHILAAFGGAVGQHACDIARALGITRVALHKYSSVLSAYGMALADTTQEERRPCSEILSTPAQPHILSVFNELEVKATRSIHETDPTCKFLESSYFLNLRYEGSDTPLMIEKPTESWDFATRFIDQHYHEFGYTPTGWQIVIDDIRVRTTAKTVSFDAPGLSELGSMKETRQVDTKITTIMFFNETGLIDVPMFQLQDIHVGETVRGPAVVIDHTQTIVITPNATATALSSMLVIDVDSPPATDPDTVIDPIRLSVFANRFMVIAEQMGRVLQKTSVSTNIKERLDFSCAIFSAEGGLVANAPHVPAMLGSMANSVRWQIEHWAGNIKEGDAFRSNAPNAGGAHLPDLTVISPVFDASGKNVLFWTASRGHHADVGGIVPGSMPAMSKEIGEEGAVIESIKIIENGIFQDDRLHEAMGARSFQDNITDIKAQTAANQKGNNLIGFLIKEYTLDTVLRASENAVRELLKKMVKEKGRCVFEAEDFMDDGSRILLNIKIDPVTGSADFDFTGTSPQAYGNWNAPRAVSNAGIIYALRCLVDGDNPLNQGCLLPVNVVIPDGCLLAPTKDAAVAAGNGLTNQRLVDVILKAFEVCAASNGCMANFTFGLGQKNGFGYYETIAGGSGAGPTWAGEDGIHCHMSNTRITDPEVLGRRYPVLLREFSRRKDSGGVGQFRGGDGVIREIEFLIDMHAGILSERRVFQPYGMAGGQPAARGLNLWIRRSGQVINVGGKASCNVGAGDRLRICTPGGGGYGIKESMTAKIH